MTDDEGKVNDVDGEVVTGANGVDGEVAVGAVGVTGCVVELPDMAVEVASSDPVDDVALVTLVAWPEKNDALGVCAVDVAC